VPLFNLTILQSCPFLSQLSDAINNDPKHKGHKHQSKSQNFANPEKGFEPIVLKERTVCNSETHKIHCELILGKDGLCWKRTRSNIKKRRNRQPTRLIVTNSNATSKKINAFATTKNKQNKDLIFFFFFLHFT
jgi:hypothetical protein